WVAIVASVAIFPLQPNQTPDLSLRAALTATSSPPARALVLFSGTATRFETTTSCPNGNPFRRLTASQKYNPQGSSMLRPFSLAYAQSLVEIERRGCASNHRR